MATLPAYKLDSEHAALGLRKRFMPQISAAAPSGVLPIEKAVSIKLSGVSFQYEDEWRPALKDISTYRRDLKPPLSVRADQGKPPSSNCAQRTPTDGQIRLNDTSVMELNETSIWQASKVVRTVILSGHHSGQPR